MPRARVPALILSLLALAAGAPAPRAWGATEADLVVFSARARAPVLVHVVASAGGGLALAGRAAETLRPRALLDPRPAESLIEERWKLSRCEQSASLSCWLDLAAGLRPAPLFVWVISAHDAGGGAIDLVQLLLDVPLARRIAAAGDRGLEDRLYAGATTSTTTRVRRDDSPGIARALETLFFASRELRDRLAARGLLGDSGAIRVRAAPAGVLEVDGRALGVTRGGDARIDDLAPGDHEIVLRAAEGRVLRGRATITAPGEERVIELAEPRAEPISIGAYGGLVIAGGGALLVALAALAHQDQVVLSPCAAGRCADGPSWATAGDVFSDAPAGPPVAPIGFWMLAGGGAWAAGALFDRDRALWWLLGGALAGAGVFAASVALD